MNHTGVIIVTFLGLGFALAVHFGSKYKEPLHRWAEKHLR
jgi:hypothetical protein